MAAAGAAGTTGAFTNAVAGVVCVADGVEAASSQDAMQKNINELFERVAALERERDVFKSLSEKLSTILAIDKDCGTCEYKNGELRTINAIIRKVSGGDIITPQIFYNIEKFSDTKIYAEATWFHNQLIAAFNKIYFNIHISSHPASLTFDEVKNYIQDISKMESKALIICYIDKLKP